MDREFGPELPELFELDGKIVRLDYVGAAKGDYSEWLAESPELFMPSLYSLTEVATGDRNEFLVFGEGGFSPFEMAAHLAVSREGATPLDSPASMNEDLDCEHGLSAALCCGPNHYPMEF